jgi:hypothetical protein
MEELVRHLTTTEIANGLANRFEFFCVQRSKILPFGGSLDAGKLSKLVADVRKALNESRHPGELEFAPDAKECWASRYAKLSSDRPGLAGAILGRMEAQTLRLACLYATLDGVRVISIDALNAALALVRYYEDSVKYIFGDLIGDPDADAILGSLRSQPEGLTRTNINNYFARNLSAARIEAALIKLLTLKLARSESVGTGGRPAELWHAIDNDEV